MVERRDVGGTPPERHDIETEMATTVEVKRQQPEPQSVLTPLESEPGIEAAESALETPKPPRPVRRMPGTRFPVRPSMSGIDISAERAANSPNHTNPPPIPTRSHFRIASGQNGTRPRRPTIALLQNGGTGSNRSNSETVLQASAAARLKRMGMMRKGKLDLEPVEEMRANRIGHLRGVSHGSVLRSKSSNAVSPGNGQGGSTSPQEGGDEPSIYLKRLSSLPEYKQVGPRRSPTVNAAKGILYALYQIHPHISGLIGVIKCRDLKLTSLELTYYNASSHVERLNDALEQAGALDQGDEESIHRSENTVQRDCASCIMAYLHVILQLQESVKKIVADADARYVRTLMLLLYGSMIEIQNAVKSFNVEIRVLPSPISRGTAQTLEPAAKEGPSRREVDRSFPPSNNRPDAAIRAGPHHSSNTSFAHLTLRNIGNLPPNQRHPHSHHAACQQSSQYTYGAPTASNPHRGNGAPLQHPSASHSLADYSLSSRSRSNTRSTNAMTLTDSSLVSSVTNTPRSGESFQLPGFQAQTQVNPLTGLSDPQEEALFESIYLALSRAYDAALQALPIARRQFARFAEMAEEDRQPREIRGMWRNLVGRCKACFEASESLHLRLINMKVRDTPNKGRDDRSFWQLTKSFTQSFIDLVAEMKEAKSRRLLPQEIVVILRPVQKASREAVRLIDASPWAYLTEAGSQPLGLPPLVTNDFLNGYETRGNGHDTRGSQNIHSGYANGFHHSIPSHAYSYDVSAHAAAQGISPGSAALPATPLSAALGPAAQATIPSAPSSTYGGDCPHRNGEAFLTTRHDPRYHTQQANGNLYNSRR